MQRMQPINNREEIIGRKVLFERLWRKTRHEFYIPCRAASSSVGDMLACPGRPFAFPASLEQPAHQPTVLASCSLQPCLSHLQPFPLHQPFQLPQSFRLWQRSLPREWETNPAALEASCPQQPSASSFGSAADFGSSSLRRCLGSSFLQRVSAHTDGALCF